jgi:hypothetical protein
MTDVALSKFPKHPTTDERETLSSYFYLSSRLYPCGECAAEFQELLKKYPPQVRPADLLVLVYTYSSFRRRQDGLLHCGDYDRINVHCSPESHFTKAMFYSQRSQQAAQETRI